MGIPLEELQDRIDAPTFALYMAHDRIDPFGEERGDLRMAINTAFTVNAMTGQKVKIADFMPDFENKGKKGPTADELLAKMQQYTAQHNTGKAQ